MQRVFAVLSLKCCDLNDPMRQERLKPRLGGIDPASIGEEDFSTGGALAHLQMELQLWASYRGQLLARTVRGAP